jgi:hypothetical protein
VTKGQHPGRAGRRVPQWARHWTAVLLIVGTPALGADLFFLDHDPFTREYVGPTGPLVLSGEIAPGDYDRLLAKISEDQNRFLGQNKLILASDGGDVSEAINIAKLVRSLYTQVVVGPLTGKCAGPCFLIYTAANQRGTDGQRLLGMSRPYVDDAESATLPPAEVALRQDTLAMQVRAFLQENAVPADLVEEMLGRLPSDVYWLSESDEVTLGIMSPPFAQLLAAKCAWDDNIAREVYGGKRPLEDLKQMWACRDRLTQAAAQKALSAALKEKSVRDANAKLKDAPPPPCHKKGIVDSTTDECPQSNTTRGK